MPRALRYADAAIRDLAAIRRWQTQPGAGRAAGRRLQLILGAIRGLLADPCLFPVGTHPGIRELPCEGHRVMYVIDPDTGRSSTAGDILVLRVFGPGQSRDRL